MCFGYSAPQQPKIEYVGPSEEDIAANQAALDQYQAQLNTQQEQFQTQLQGQIDAANAETQSLQDKLARQAADMEAQMAAANNAAMARAGAEQTAQYAITASQSDPGATAQTTSAIEKKKKPKSTLRISRNALQASAGTGLNIGV
jgi:DNA repair exonuclease SbcCD ATPase subunit|tara:strand:+ start:80 stop:514 length:435 start_codon:yes stop_codon:yes gene_type:complete